MTVRNESVRLSLIDAGFTAGMAKAAGAAGLLERSLDDLDGTNVRASRGLPTTAREVDNLGGCIPSQLRRHRPILWSPRADPEGRRRARSRAGSDRRHGVPAITGLASSLGFAALGAGSLVTAFQGVGDALKTFNEAALDPTADEP